jgi:nucleotide-binding universal stress UspA family protein
MNDFKQILCPVDFSEASLRAMSYATRLGAKLQIPLTLFHVIAPLPTYTSTPEAMVAFPPPVPPDDLTRESYAAERLRNLQRQVDECGYSASVEVLNGAPGHVIVEQAGRQPGTLLVMGTHGYSGFQRFVLGSTTIEVLRRAPCPVVTVREQHPDGDLRRIGVAVDFSAACEPAIETAVRLARRVGAQLHLIHVLAPLELPYAAETRIPLYVTQVTEANQKAAERELEEIAARIDGVEVVRALLMGTAPYRHISQYAEHAQLDLLAIGTHGRTGLRRLFLGSETERTLQVSPCPVMSVRMPGDVPAQLTWREVAEDLKLKA